MSPHPHRLRSRAAPSPSKWSAARHRPPIGAWWLRALLALFAVLSGAASEVQLSEYVAKAAFVAKFLGYVKWPDSAFENAHSPLRIAVLGADPFGKTLDETFDGKLFGARHIEIVRFKTVAEIERCQVLFVPNADGERLPRILERLDGRSVLVIGESADFAANGGCINFVLEDKKIRFEINKDAAARASLDVSSQLLRLAKIVKDAKREDSR